MLVFVERSQVFKRCGMQSHSQHCGNAVASFFQKIRLLIVHVIHVGLALESLISRNSLFKKHLLSSAAKNVCGTCFIYFLLLGPEYLSETTSLPP